MAQLLIISSEANPVCQEGQSERTFPIFAFSSRFLVFPDFSWFFPSFSHFWQIFCCQGWQLCHPLTPSGYATVNNINCALMGYAILSHILWGASLNTSNLTNQTNLECIDFLKIPLSLDWSAQMRWDKDHNIVIKYTLRKYIQTW